MKQLYLPKPFSSFVESKIILLFSFMLFAFVANAQTTIINESCG